MDKIELRDMELALILAEERNFSRTASRCFMAQPALSKCIRRVETALGFDIFDRSRQPLGITPAGAGVLDRFRRIREEYTELEHYCGRVTRENRTDLTIAAPSFFCTFILPPVIADFSVKHPEIRIRLMETNDSDLEELLESHTADLGISVNKQLMQHFDSFVLYNETIILAVPASSPVNSRLREYRLKKEEILNGDLLDPSLPEVPLEEFKDTDFLFLRAGNDLRERALRLCARAGFYPRITMELDQLLTAFYLAAAGRGAAFIRAASLHYTGLTESLCFYKLAEPDASRNVYMLQKGAPSRNLALFLEYLRSYPFPEKQKNNAE